MLFSCTCTQLFGLFLNHFHLFALIDLEIYKNSNVNLKSVWAPLRHLASVPGSSVAAHVSSSSLKEKRKEPLG